MANKAMANKASALASRSLNDRALASRQLGSQKFLESCRAYLGSMNKAMQNRALASSEVETQLNSEMQAMESRTALGIRQ
jgi:hypothetical protein